MSKLDELARSVEQSEAAVEALAKLLTIIWNNLNMPDEYKIRILEKYLDAMANRTNTG